MQILARALQCHQRCPFSSRSLPPPPRTRHSSFKAFPACYRCSLLTRPARSSLPPRLGHLVSQKLHDQLSPSRPRPSCASGALRRNRLSNFLGQPRLKERQAPTLLRSRLRRRALLQCQAAALRPREELDPPQQVQPQQPVRVCVRQQRFQHIFSPLRREESPNTPGPPCAERLIWSRLQTL